MEIQKSKKKEKKELFVKDDFLDLNSHKGSVLNVDMDIFVSKKNNNSILINFHDHILTKIQFDIISKLSKESGYPYFVTISKVRSGLELIFVEKKLY